MFKHLVIAIVAIPLLAACGGGEPDDDAATEMAKPLLLVSQDLIIAQPESLSHGPVIAGSLQPELRADLRAEVSGVVLEVLKDNGDVVSKGDLLLRIDATAIRDNLLSAQEAERTAEAALDQAERQFKRMQSVVEKGLVAVETVETAEGSRNQAQSALASARARVVESEQLLEKTEVRAPFNGVVAARNVSAGNTVQVGMELIKVLDIGTMRFEGMITADEVSKVNPHEGSLPRQRLSRPRVRRCSAAGESRRQRGYPPGAGPGLAAAG
jgi:RND family efflux transporter MFP subunit